jgi:hypothetical protein
MTNKNIITVFGVVTILVLGLFMIYGFRGSVVNNVAITSFEECKNAGYPIMESYPAQCRDAKGNNFVQIIDNPNPEPGPNPNVPGPCYVGGCSSQICSDQKDMMSTCEYREEYACYKKTTCERQSSGQCGWTQTPALTSCLNSSTRVAAGYLTGHVTIGPFCPVEREGEPCKVPQDAYTSREAVVYESNGTTVKERIHLNKDGNYNFVLGPGKYFVQIVPAGIGAGEKKPVTITSFETTTINFDIDTGIR